jgi:hypothetical protein
MPLQVTVIVPTFNEGGNVLPGTPDPHLLRFVTKVIYRPRPLGSPALDRSALTSLEGAA